MVCASEFICCIFFVKNGALIVILIRQKYDLNESCIFFQMPSLFRRERDAKMTDTKKITDSMFKLHRSLSYHNHNPGNTIHLYDHTIKPILLFGSLGMFVADSAACKNRNEYFLE